MNRLPVYFRFTLADLILLAVGFIILPQLFPSFANDPGLGWHLKSGELMRESGPLYFDPFLATPEPLPWVPDQWLGSVILSAMFDWGGWPLLYGFIAAIIISGYILILFLSCKARESSPVLCAIAVLVAFEMSRIQLFIRPLAFSFLFLSLLSLFLYSRVKALRQGKAALGRKDYLLVPLFFALWANIHPYFSLGLVLLSLAYFGVVVDTFVLKRVTFQRSFLLGAPVIGLCSLFATLLTPYGLDLHRTILSLGSSDFFTNFLSEWKPLSDSPIMVEKTVMYLLVLAGGYLISKELRRSWGCYELFLLFALLYLAVDSIRFVPVFVILTAPLFVQSLRALLSSRWLDKFRPIFSLKKNFTRYSLYESESRSVFVTAVILIVPYLFFPLIQSKLPLYGGELGPSRDVYPYEAVNWLREEARETNTTVTVMNDLSFGGFIAFYGYPELRYIVDDRLTLREERFYKQYVKYFLTSHDSNSRNELFQSDYILRANTHENPSHEDALVVKEFKEGVILRREYDNHVSD